MGEVVGERESNQHAPASSSPQSPPRALHTPARQCSRPLHRCVPLPNYFSASSWSPPRWRGSGHSWWCISRGFGALALGVAVGAAVAAAVGAAAGAPDSPCEINCMNRAGAAFPVVPTWLPSGFSFLCGRAVLARADGHLRQQRGPKCHSGC